MSEAKQRVIDRVIQGQRAFIERIEQDLERLQCLHVQEITTLKAEREDLLAACESFLLWWRMGGWSGGGSQALVSQVERAIAQAKGEANE